MAQWIKKQLKLKKITNLLKDQVSLGLAMSKLKKFPQIEVAILKTINHEENVPDEDCVQSLLMIGRSSRMHVAHCVGIIMDRLNKSHNWVVVIKCLIIIHRCLFEGGFMFQDQISIHPAQGGRNYLNLSRFRDSTSLFTWEMSGWIRWYAKFIEQWIQTSIVIGDFLDMKMMDEDSAMYGEKLKGMMNKHLIGEILGLNELLQEVCGWETGKVVMDHPLVKEGLRLATFVILKAYREIKLRLKEIQSRIKTLVQSQVLELLKVCDKLSANSMMLTYFFEMCEDPLLQQNRTVCREVLFSHYELMQLKEALRLASTEKHSTKLDMIDIGIHTPSSIQSLSMRYSKPSANGWEVKRGGSMSHFNYYETFL